ncbi:MAG: hypothetical protein KAI66_01340, partial [Lentisphaeria bacterium]|nr:hypothetical protein [Lentisphaeria bacterium]
VESGWTRITETDVHTEENGRGWILKRTNSKRPHKLYARDENFATDTRFLKLGAVFRDHVIAGRNYSGYPNDTYAFRMRTGDGEFVAALVLGIMTEKRATTINRPPFWWRDYAVNANGRNVVNVTRGGIHDTLREQGRLSETDFLPGDSLFDRAIRPHFPVHRFTFRGPELLLSMDTFCPLKALLIAPKGEEEALEKAVELLFERERALVDSQYGEDRNEEVLSPRLRRHGKKAGALLFTRPMRKIGPYARPGDEEAGRPCGEFTASGEMGILTFGVLPLRELRNVQFEAGEFVRPGGTKLPVGCATSWLSQLIPMQTLRTGNRYRITPDYAFPYTARTLAANVTRMVHVYVKVPPNTPAGDYEGTLTLQSVDLPRPVSQRLVIKVLPFQLDPPDLLLGMYWGNPMSTRLRHAWQQIKLSSGPMRELCGEVDLAAFREMREMGFNTAAFGPGRPFTGIENGEVQIDEHLWNLWCDRVSNFEKVFGRNPLPAYGIGWGGLISERNTNGFWGRNIGKWEKHGFSDEAIRNMELLCTKFYQEGRARNWPEILFYVQDEMANHGSRGGRMATERAKLFRKVADKVGFRTCASMNGPVEMPSLPFLHIAIPNGALPITEENLERIRDDGCELWFYNIGSTRFSFGYYLNRTRPKGRLQWSFGNTSRYLDHVAGLPSLGAVSYTLHWDSQLRPGRRWNVEDMRQGILDYRYMHTLKRLLDAHRTSADSAIRQAVAEGDALHGSILESVKIRNRHSGEDFVSGVWTSRTCQRQRWRVALAILAIQKASGTRAQ